MNESSQHALERPLGCFGGTFNPPHRAHFALAHAACEQLNLPNLLLIPTGQPWQKPHVLPAAHRLTMLRLALADDRVIYNAFESSENNYPLHIDPIEINLPQASYTIDTLHSLRARMPNTPLIWVIGSDQLLNLTTWRDWQQLLDFCHIAVAQRAGAEVSPEYLPEPLNHFYAKHVCHDDSWRRALNGRFIPFGFTPFPISSTQIRSAIAAGESAKQIDSLSPNVADYIFEYELYR